MIAVKFFIGLFGFICLIKLVIGWAEYVSRQDPKFIQPSWFKGTYGSGYMAKWAALFALTIILIQVL